MPDGKTRSVSDAAVFLSIHFESFGNRRKVEDSKFEVDCDKDHVRMTKRLLDLDELKAIGSLDADTLRFVKSRCLPFQEALHALPIASVEEVEEELQKRGVRREALVETAADKYEEACAEAAHPLRSLHNNGDYISRAEFKARFRMTWGYVTLTTPGKLKMVNPKLFEKEVEKMQSEMDELFQEWRQAMTVGFGNVVERLKESLVPGPDGKVRKLTDASVEHLQEFLATFQAKNSLVRYEELAPLASQLKSFMAGVTVDRLKESEAYRDQVGAALSKAAQSISTIAVGVRHFRDDE
jgi:hypothetical protein